MVTPRRIGSEVVKVEEALDLDNLARRIAEGYIVEREGPGGLVLWNYTAKAQYERVWDQETRRCRGLVAHRDGYVVARPFEKFFNLGEHAEGTLPLEPFEVTTKLDGSLICVARADVPDWWAMPNLSMTSRGAFNSEHAAAARTIWQARYADVEIPEGETWCFELLAPWNRIVCDYGGREDLILLARIDNATGRDVDLTRRDRMLDWPGECVGVHHFADLPTIAARLPQLGADDEGYVIRFLESGLRVKAKGDEYVRLHKLITGCTARHLWELLATGQSLAPALERVPDEFYAWVRQTGERIQAAHDAVIDAARAAYALVVHLPTRKDQALAIAAAEPAVKDVVFKMLDGKPYDEYDVKRARPSGPWKAAYPDHERPFRVDPDA